MKTAWTRRGVMGIVCTSGLLSGCIGAGGNDVLGGDLVLENRDATAHEVTITVARISEDSDDMPGNPDGRPIRTPIQERTTEFSLDAGEKSHREAFIDDPGTFYVRVRLGTGVTGRGWIGLYRTADGGAGGDFLDIEITEESQVVVKPVQAGA